MTSVTERHPVLYSDYAKESRESAKESANRSAAQRAGQDTSSTASSSGSRARQASSDTRSLDTIPLTSPALPTGPSPSTRLAQATSPVRLTYPGFVVPLMKLVVNGTYILVFDVTGIRPRLAKSGQFVLLGLSMPMHIGSAFHIPTPCFGVDNIQHSTITDISIVCSFMLYIYITTTLSCSARRGLL